MLDGATTEVIRSYLLSAAEEMRRTLIRTAFNPVIYEVLDFGISVYNRRLELIAEAAGLTFFLGANDYAIRKGVAYVGEENLEPGDIVLMNYPYWNSAHAMDVTLFAPVFAPSESSPFAYTCIRAHWMDLGAKDPGYVLDSTDMHQEGLIFPGTKVYKRGKPDEEILELIRFNSRMPELVLGDLDAQVAATRTGQRRLVQIHQKFGEEMLDQAIRQTLDHGEKLTRKALAGLPRGSWSAEDYLDDDGISDDMIPMKVTVTLDGELFRVDFSESSDAVRGPVNVPFGLTETMCKVVLKSITTPLSPCNEGNFRPLEVIAPAGNLFHAVYPAATFTLWSAIVGLELIYKALAQGLPELLAASSGGDVPGFMMVGTHPESGRFYAVSNNDPVGWGASAGQDGINATNHLSGSLVRNTPVEVLEMKTAMAVEQLQLRADSGGAGRFRGGLGIRRDVRFRAAGEFLSVMKKTKTPPWALEGGREPAPNSMLLYLGRQEEQRVGTYRAAVERGDRASNQTAGGGGYGDPALRDPQRVLEDVLDGYVTTENARRLYRVAIKDKSIDLVETKRLRSSAAEEMRRTLIRTAFNPVIYEVLDFGISIYNRNLDLIAEAPGLSFFLGANDFAIVKCLEKVGEENLRPGDILLMNYPYWNSAHALDVTLFAPVFAPGQGHPFAYTCIRAHWMDLGAKDPGYVLDSTDMHQEGLIFPAIHLYREGKRSHEIVELIRFNSRMPELVLGDLDAQVAASRTGRRRLLQIYGKFGPETLDRAISQSLDYGERLTLRALSELPAGSWSAEDFLDGDGISDEVIPMKVRVSIRPDLFEVDFTGSSGAVPGPVNIPYGRTQTMCKVVLKSLTTPRSPSNAGHFRPLRVIAPEGSLFHARYPSATFTQWSSIVALEMIFKALARGMPERVAASSGGDVPGFMMVGRDPVSGRLYAGSNNDAVGWGASAHQDGRNAANHLSQTLVRNTPIEVFEMKAPLFFERLELRSDSGGAGRFRGGLGLRRDIRFRAEGEFLSVMKKTKSRPWALAGGQEPEPCTMLLDPDTPQEKRVGTYRAAVKAGDRASNRTAGGGGFGPPADRDPSRILEDVRDGLVSIEAARRIYRVVIRNGQLDQEATRELRRL